MDLKLETKFIKDTNNQYSIRNDGVVISHYLYCARYNKTVFRDKILAFKNNKDQAKCATPSVLLYINKQGKSMSVQKLLLKYFNFTFCSNCKAKMLFSEESNKRFCINCRSKTDKKQYASNYVKTHADKYAEYNKKSRIKNLSRLKPLEIEKSKQQIKTLAKSYVAACLRIPTALLTEELYDNCKKTILLKREIYNLNK
jgi:hypothetical protein